MAQPISQGQVWEVAATAGGGGVTDHGALTGLGDNDHPQYALESDFAAHEAHADPHPMYQKEAEKGAASGYASLDGSTKIPIAQMPTGTSSSTVALGDAPAAAVATHAAATTTHGVSGDIVGTTDGQTLSNKILTTPSIPDFSNANHDHSNAAGGGAIAAAAIPNNAVTDARLRDSAALSVIGRASNSTGDPADIAAANDAEVLRRSGTSLGFGTVATAGIADNAVSNAKIRDSGALSVIGRSANSSGDPADISASAASGAVLRESGSTLGFGTVATAGIADGAVTDAKLRNSGACSVIGRANNSAAAPADISAGSNGHVLQRAANVVQFAQLDHTSLASIGTNTHAQIDTHIAATAAHGATGAVVGTTNTQTLTNKTFDSTSDLGGHVGAKGRTIYLTFAGEDTGAGLTAVASMMDGLHMDTPPLPILEACKVVRMAVNIQHNHASDPGDWRLVFERNSDNLTALLNNCQMDNTGLVSNVKHGAPSTELTLAAGETVRCYVDGPSCDHVRFRVLIKLVTT